jgi:hypothetical protein
MAQKAKVHQENQLSLQKKNTLIVLFLTFLSVCAVSLLNILFFHIFLGKCIPGNYSDGRDYRGTLDHTIDGHTCQKWSKQYPWTHQLLPFPYDDKENKEDGIGTYAYVFSYNRT